MAVGDTLVIFIPSNGEPRELDFATPDLVNGHLVWDFQPYDGDTRRVIFPGIIPKHFSGDAAKIEVYLHYTMTSAIVNNIAMIVSFNKLADGNNMISDNYGTAVNTGDVGVPGTAGILDITTTTHDNAEKRDSIVPGDGFHLKVARANPTGTDATGDLELWRIELREA